MNREHRTPAYGRDPDGREIVTVPLSGGAWKPAVIYRKDFEQITAQGYSDQWTLNGCGSLRYVRTHSSNRRGTLVSVARLVLGEVPGQVVRYRDGDRLNLRSWNLYHTSGKAPGVTPRQQRVTK